MRKDDHQFFQDMYIASFGAARSRREVRRGGHGLGLEADRHRQGGRHRAADDLQDGAALTGLDLAVRNARASLRGRVHAELVSLSPLNGVLFGMLLFMMASGLTLIFSMMGVLNFAHASFYMLGAYFGFEIEPLLGFWPGFVVAPLLVGAIGALVERYGLRRVHRYGHVAELLFTFGLAFVIEELVQMIWGKLPVDYRVPPSLDFVAFRVFDTNYPAYRMFMLVDGGRDVRVPARRAEANPRRADHPGRADASEHGRPCSATTCRASS